MGWLNPPVRFEPDGTYWDNGIDGHYATGLDFDSYGTEWAAYGDIYSYNSEKKIRGFLEKFPTYWLL